jgi:hypothetical protein
MPDGRVYELGINEPVVVKRGWLVKSCVIFGGMPSESTYSLIMTFTSCHNSIAYNLTIPKNQSEVKLIKGRMIVQRVTPTGISFRIEGTEKAMGRTPL